MALADIVRSGIATANKVTAGLQVSVLHRAWVGDDSHAKPVYGVAISRQALVEKKQRLLTQATGQQVLQRTLVTFVGPVLPNGAAERREPIDPRDEITLPDGSSGPVLDVQGLADPATSLPYMIQVSLG